MATTEDLNAFRLRARTWLAENMPLLKPGPPPAPTDGDWDRSRELQRRLFDGGFAGLCFPVEYGGQGLTVEYQKAFTEESLPYEMPLLFNAPTLGMCASTIFEFGTEEQKKTLLPEILRGESYWVQFLSEPRGGSDLAGLITRAERTETGWVLNGAKTWSTAAYAADWALCLARTNWDVPKHEGLTMFIVRTNAPGVEMRQIRMVNGSQEFCEEFLDNVHVGHDAVLGEVNDGWAVVSRQLFHERSTAGGGSPYTSGVGRSRLTRTKTSPVSIIRESGRSEDPAAHELLGRWYARETAQRLLGLRLKEAIGEGHLPPTAASMMMLAHSLVDAFTDDVCLQLAGAGAAVAQSTSDPLRVAPINFLMRQASSLGGGSAEMSRNMIAERFLGLPREPAPDRGVPFREVSRA